MKNSKIIVTIIGILVLLGIATFLWSFQNNKEANPSLSEGNTEASSIVGCYVSRTGKDVYTMNIREVQGNNFTGSLDFDNFEKDSSSGTYNGTYENEILRGEYAFQSEGSDSVMEVVFKRFGTDFVRGYGELEEDGTKFSNIEKVSYDPTSSLNVFKKEVCAE